jgi:nucleotide-binding universal stress UspA family protein
MFKKILFCTDFSEDAHWAFTYAFNLAETYRSKLLIVHVIGLHPYTERLSTYLTSEELEELRISQKRELEKETETRYLQKMGNFKDYQVLLKEGEPFLEIIQTAKKEAVDLIVMGTHGRTALDNIIFGSTADKVVRKSPCPVLTVRLPGKQFVMP